LARFIASAERFHRGQDCIPALSIFPIQHCTTPTDGVCKRYRNGQTNRIKPNFLAWLAHMTEGLAAGGTAAIRLADMLLGNNLGKRWLNIFDGYAIGQNLEVVKR